MRRLIVPVIALIIVFALSTTSSMAQSAPNLIDIGVNLSCSSISVSLSSDYDTPIIAQVYAGTSGQTEWNLVDDIGNFTAVGANGSGSKSYSFAAQQANTQISFSVRVYDDLTNTLLDALDGTRDCDGDANNSSSTTTSTSTTTSVVSTTATFLASCDSSGGILVQPIGGIAFSITGTQIAQGTAMAIANGQNMTIISANGVTAIGTPANAIQLIASDGYNITIPASSCVATVSVSTGVNTSVASQAASLSCSSTPASAVNVHVVRGGENLFRIGLRYGIHFTRLASYNGIPDATRIFVGQCIAIPPA